MYYHFNIKYYLILMPRMLFIFLHPIYEDLFASLRWWMRRSGAGSSKRVRELRTGVVLSTNNGQQEGARGSDEASRRLAEAWSHHAESPEVIAGLYSAVQREQSVERDREPQTMGGNRS